MLLKGTFSITYKQCIFFVLSHFLFISCQWEQQGDINWKCVKTSTPWVNKLCETDKL